MSDQPSPGYGQLQTEFVGNDTDMIVFLCRQLINRLDTMKLVQVKAVHPGQGSPPAAGTVDVLPLVNQIDGKGYAVPHGTVFGVPYWRLQAGAWAFIADPVAGDIGYVVCADRDSSAVVRTQAQANPGSRRKYSVADGVYMGGCLNPAPSQYVQLKADGTLEIADGKGNVLSTSSNGFSLTGNLAVTGTITATGNITAGQGGADQVGLQSHTHGGVETGSSQTLEPTAGT